jgi:hypothetical protein
MFHKCLLHDPKDTGTKTTCVCGGSGFLPDPKNLPTCYHCDRAPVRHRIFCDQKDCTYNIALCTQCSNFIVKNAEYTLASEMCLIEYNKHRLGVHGILEPILYNKIHDLVFLRVIERIENE